MPIYTYEGACGCAEDHFRSVAERHNAPACLSCGGPMWLVISPVRGIVRFPAAGGQEYVSTTTGKYITTERARQDDLKRSGCRPWEGFDAEVKEAKKRSAEEEKVSDAKLHDSVSSAYYQLSPDKRKALAAG